ncbi:hypothetical protein MMC30_007771 [Trapelia coarctata]|nr:hypothetical protein [Trapelia coarctata]
MRFMLFNVISIPFVAAGKSQRTLIQNNCCASLSQDLGRKVAYPSRPLYNDSLSSYWSKQEQELMPSCIVTPESEEDVSSAVRVLTRSSHKSIGQCKFAIKGGGHTMWAGAANIDDGVTIDLGALNDVAVNKARNVAFVGAGARWLNVYSRLDSLGLSVVGGRDSDVGVAGLTLGGGLSYFSPRFGFVCDNVVNYEIVLASGGTVNANATSHPDLYFALKGGSNNFGIVTRFDFKTFPQGKIWGGPISYDISTKDDQLQAFTQFAGNEDYDEYATVIHAYAFLSEYQNWMISNSYAYTKPEAYPVSLKEFMTIPRMHSGVRMASMTELAVEMSQSNPSGKRQTYVTAAFGNDALLLSRIFDIANGTLQHIQHVPGLLYALAYQPIPRSMLSHSEKSGGNALGLDSADGNLVLASLSISWADTVDDKLVASQAKRFVQEVESVARSLRLIHRWKYLNYAAEWQDPIAGYGKVNKEKLWATSRQYDPHGVFVRQVPGGFKLPSLTD